MTAAKSKQELNRTLQRRESRHGPNTPGITQANQQSGWQWKTGTNQPPDQLKNGAESTLAMLAANQTHRSASVYPTTNILQTSHVTVLSVISRVSQNQAWHYNVTTNQCAELGSTVCCFLDKRTWYHDDASPNEHYHEHPNKQSLEHDSARRPGGLHPTTCTQVARVSNGTLDQDQGDWTHTVTPQQL